MTQLSGLNLPRLIASATMSSPTTDPPSEEEIQFTTSSSPVPAPGFWPPPSIHEEKMEGVEDDDGDEPFTDAQSDLDDAKRDREAQSPPKAPKKPRDATTGAPSPNSRDANKDEILEDADDEDAEDSRAPPPPSDPAKVDISKTPHRPRKEYIRLVQNLTQPQRIVAGTTYSAMTGEPKTSPSQITPKVHKLLQRIHQQTRCP